MLCVFFRLATAAALNTHIIWQKRGQVGVVMSQAYLMLFWEYIKVGE